MTDVMPEVVAKPLDRDRTDVDRGFSGKVIRDGGDRGAGLLQGVSVIRRGEARGHEMWCDMFFVNQVSEALNAKGKSGLKTRFTHPGLSADGLAKFLGNTKASRVVNDAAYADTHISKSAHKTPGDRNLADYVLTMADDDPDKLGNSIVFKHDEEAEAEFMQLNTNSDGEFQSPDPLNTRNLPHCRLEDLRAVDLVDFPATNPDGLFSDSQDIAVEATQLMEYALGLNGATRPVMGEFNLDPDRCSAFFSRFLKDHGLQIAPLKQETELMDPQKTDENPKDNNSTLDTENEKNKPSESESTGSTESTESSMSRDAYTTQLDKFTSKFGAENGVKWFKENLSYTEALEKHAEVMGRQLATQKKEVDKLNQTISSANLGEQEPFDVNGDSEPKKPTRLSELIRFSDSLN